MSRHALGPESEFNAGTLTRVEAGGRELCLARTDSGGFYAIDDQCTHEQASLSDGDLYGCEIQCPLHNSKFDLVTGAVRGLPATDTTTTYPTLVESGVVYVEMD